MNLSYSNSTVFAKTPPRITRKKKVRPPSLILPPNNEPKDIAVRDASTFSPLLRDSNCVIVSTAANKRTKVMTSNRRRPVSLFSSQNTDSLVPSPPFFSSSPNEHTISPLALPSRCSSPTRKKYCKFARSAHCYGKILTRMRFQGHYLFQMSAVYLRFRLKIWKKLLKAV